MKKLHPLLILSLSFGAAFAGDEPSWRGAALSGWTQWTHQARSATASNGVLRVVCGGADTHVYSSSFDLPATARQVLVFRAKGSCGGLGELFWMPPGKGAKQAWSCHFDWKDDGAWHEYRVRPFWQGEGRIGKLRLDFPSEAADGGVFEIDGISIVEDAADTPTGSADRHVGVMFATQSATPGMAEIAWAGEGRSGLQRETVRLPGDGRRHVVYLNLQERPAWKGAIGYMRVTVEPGVSAPADLAFVETDPDLPADLVVKSARATDAFNRVGAPVPVTLVVQNLGSRPARGVRVAAENLPAGVRLAKVGPAEDIYGGETATLVAEIDCATARAFDLSLSVAGQDGAPTSVRVPVRVLPSLGLPRADYVPEPRPVETDYDLAALYFPGWATARAWKRVWRLCPERKPVLGWYDEANPECVDWQIKWLVENGIRTLYVDWYWCKGSQHLDHWVKAFYRARYRRHLKWAMMWANHNPSGSHSVEDQRAVTKFWIENYFNTPEYLRIGGKPVVWIWSPQNMDRDLGANGCQKLLQLSRDMAVAAGYPGIHFIAMKWPEADCSASTTRKYAQMGFDETGIYHFMSHGGRCSSNRRFPYRAVAEANPMNWWRQYEANVLPFLPNLSTGWDDRPWNDHCEIYGKNAEDFRKICRAAKAFSDKTGVRRLCLAPLNEWGEGSYAEPNAEHGFGFYEAVRETFCRRPADGWPLNYGPKDVGLGPYDLPPPPQPRRTTAWTFAAGDAQDWSAMMGVRDFRATDEGLVFTSVNHDPAISCSFVPVVAKEFRSVVVRMKVEGRPAGSAQLFWAGPGGAWRESASACVPLVCDGQFHDYRFAVGGKGEWRGRVAQFRFDPCNAANVRSTVASVRLSAD